jgi:hypothetical protein
VITRTGMRRDPDDGAGGPRNALGVSDFAPGHHHPHPRCRYCGDVIGVYEPLVVRTDAGNRQTSLAADPELFATDAACFHRYCFELTSIEAMD